MAVTITGNKYTGTPTSVGTNTLTDTGASFLSADFLEDNQRIVELFSSGGVWKGVAWVDKQTSATALQLIDVFRDIDGDEVTQTTSDTYYVSKNFADVSSGSKTTTGDLVEFSDVLIFGDTTATGVCFYDQNKTVRIDAPGVSTTFAVTILGGLTTFGRVLDWVEYRTTSGCSILVSAGTGFGEGLVTNDPDARFIFAGSQFVNLNHDGGRFGGKNGQAGLFFIAMNSSTNANIVSPGSGGSWVDRADDHRLINLNYWGTGTVGSGSGVGVRWGDGIIIGGTYGFGVSNNSVGMFGSDTIAFIPQISAPAGARLAVNNLYTADTITALYRTGADTHTAEVHFTNVLTENRKAGHGASPGTDANNNVDMLFFFKENYTGLVENTDAYIYDVTQASLSAPTVISASGVFEAIVEQQSVTGHTVNSTSTSWRAAFVKYGYLPAIAAFASSTVSVGRGLATDVVFGGPVAQTVDLLLTETTKATVDAYATIDDAYQLYDRASSWFEDNYDAEQALYIGRSGPQSVLGAVDLIIDATAGSAFALAAGVITAKASTFTGGATATTGDVTVRNGALLSGGTFDCDINYEGGAGTTLTNVTCTGALDFDTAGTYILSGCTINEITNSSGGAVTIRALNSSVTTNTGPSVTIEYYSAITHTIKEGATPKAGALVAYYDDTNTNRTYNSSFAAATLTSDGSGNVSGYVRYRVDGTTYTGIEVHVGLAAYRKLQIPKTPTGAPFAEDLLITSDSFYTATPSANTTITFATSTIAQAGNDTMQGVYDYYKQQWLGVAANLFYAQFVAGAGSAFEVTGTFNLTTGTLSGNGISGNGSGVINCTGGTFANNVIVGSGSTVNGSDLSCFTGNVNMDGGTLDLVDLTAEQLVGSFSSGTIDLDSLSAPTTTQLDLRAVSSLGAGLTIKNDSNENITIRILPSQTAPTLDVTGPGTGTLTIDNSPTVTFAGALDDSYVRLYNVTQATELDLSTVSGGGGYSYDVAIGTGSGLAEVGDTLRADVALYRTNGTIYRMLSISGILTNTGMSLSGTQIVWTAMQEIHAKGGAYHGANVTGFALDVPNIEVDSSAVLISGWKLATWLYWQIATTGDGMRNYFDAYYDLNLYNFEVDSSYVDLKIDNTGSPATWVDASWTRSDGASIVATSSATIQFANGLIQVGIVDTPANLRAAIGMAAANLDTQLDAIPTAVENRVEMDANSTKLAQTRALAGLIPAAL